MENPMPQVCCSENRTQNCTQCNQNTATKKELLDFKTLRPIDHVLNFTIIFSVVSVAVLLAILIFKKQ